MPFCLQFLAIKKVLRSAGLSDMSAPLATQIRFALDSIDPSSVCISAAGLFTVNLQLLVSIAGASITYTVILVQTSA
ncbi:hypothetical protein V5799_032417 [Amblyomma americanum]|uniref:Uncharacterized protein n=1 Tax=Amblyomma americanum TaxID=6943 RepID=A0AAQ4DR84_AMBAM